MTDWLLDGVFGWLAARLAGLLSWLLNLLTSRLFTSPDVTVLPQVQYLADRSAAVVSGAFVLAILVAAGLVMTHGTLQVRYEVKDLLPRLVAGLGLSVFAVPLCRALIDLANAATWALVGEAASGPRVVEFVRHTLVITVADPGVRALATVITLIIVVLIFQLLTSWVFRFFTLLLVTGLAPVALAAYALPQTQPVAQLWWRSMLGALVIPGLQGIAFSAGVDLLLDPAHSLPATAGFILPGPTATTVMNLLMVTCLLLVTVRIPRLVARYALRNGGTGTAGVVVRAVVVQSVLRGTGIRGLSRLAR